jgi:ABC-type antimicrobial peptide transport system permease subunit
VDSVRREVTSVDHGLPIFRANTLQAQTEQSLLKERLLALLSSFFGGLALLLACLGLYGLMAYTVSRRTSEIGIRLALGAQRGDICWMTLRETLGLTLAGAVLGIPLALWAARYATSLLYGVEPADPWTIAFTIAVLATCAALAGSIPARRATRVDPVVALRCE